MKAVLMSIKPKYVAKILNGEKTIEVRKKFTTSYRGWVYIYCTKDKKYANLINRGGFLTGMVVARFWCDNVEEIKCITCNCGNDYYYGTNTLLKEKLGKLSCLTHNELENYLGLPSTNIDTYGYAIHISKLEIFDKPKELSEFRKPNTPTYEQTKPFAELFGNQYSMEKYQEDCEKFGYVLTKTPQSWCYVEADNEQKG